MEELVPLLARENLEIFVGNRRFFGDLANLSMLIRQRKFFSF